MTGQIQDWTTVMRWGDNVSAPAAFSSHACPWSGALVRGWIDTAPDMDMPALDHHLIVLHGGAKQLTRRRDGRSRCVQSADGAISVTGAGAGHTWSTKGPIEFTHVYLNPSALEQAIVEVFDRNPVAVHLEDRVGEDQPLLADICRALSSELRHSAAPAGMYLDSLLDVLVLTLLRRCSNLAEVSSRPRWVMSPRRLKRVLEFVEARLGEPITLDDLADTAAMSRFHFSRVFRQETGSSPYAYVQSRRVEHAKVLLRDPSLSLDAVTVAAGFGSKDRLTATFRKFTGRTPTQYRREH